MVFESWRILPGVVTSIGEEDAEVRVGNLRVRTRLADIQPLGGRSEPETGKRKKRSQQIASTPTQPSAPKAADILPASPGMELDLRGQRAEDALDSLERYLDAAYLAGLPFVRIIHGKGTGRLREVVRQALGGHPQVRSFEPGGEKEGGDGVTVAKLATS